MHGKRLAGLAHITDVYNTFSALAGLPAGDPSAIAPAPTDSLDLGPYWMGAANASPRNEIVYDHKTNVTYPHLANISYGAIRLGDYKLIRHEGTPRSDSSRFSLPARANPRLPTHEGRGEPQATWYGHFTPNRSFAGKDFVACKRKQLPFFLLSLLGILRSASSCPSSFSPCFGILRSAPDGFATRWRHVAMFVQPTGRSHGARESS